MDASRLLFLVFMVMTIPAYSDTAENQCEDWDPESYSLLEGEAFHFVPYILSNSSLPGEDIAWYKTKPQIENITTDENKNVHYHDGALFFLNLNTENTGEYIARHTDASGECSNYYLKVDVFKASPTIDSKLLYGEIENSHRNKKVPCPDSVRRTCKMLKGNFSWRKDNIALQGHHEADLRIEKASKDDQGIYSCLCTWTHNNKEYVSSASMMLKVKEPVAFRKLEIISPLNKEQSADEGIGIKLNCSVFCGTNIKKDCRATWHVGGILLQTDGYNQTTVTVNENPSKNTISTAILTIEKVSAKDFKTEFKCIASGLYEEVSVTLTLKRESIIPLVIGAVCVLFFCVFAALLVKYFAIDLALLFRPYFPLSTYNKDSRVYDAYVVYQMQSLDKATEDMLCQFVTNILPSVLEEKCGYRLFIHGRDDIPGEDRLELVEDRMKQSRRLMVILTPGSGSAPESSDQCPAPVQNSEIGGFDWQVGLHHALLQREMSVILIQLGDTGPQGYTHLPAGLQHLILKSAPVRWPEGSRSAAAWNSRFWKRVRYLMPATPARKCPQSAII